GVAWCAKYGRDTVRIGGTGVDIISSVPGNRCQALSGTSMAAPHVAGTIALLYADDPAADWRRIRNRLLSGAETTWGALNTTITGRRTQAWFALRCRHEPLVRRLQPRTSTVSTSQQLVLATYSVDCGLPYSQPSVTVAETGETLLLQDDGLGPDEVAGDG